MRRFAVVSLVLACLGAASATAAPGGRTVEKAYEVAEVDASPPAGHVRVSHTVTFKARAVERLVDVTIEDASGTSIPASVTQDVDGDDEDDVEVAFCGSTDAPVAIEPGVPVTIRMNTGWCDGVATPQEAGAPTQGTITVTFTR